MALINPFFLDVIAASHCPYAGKPKKSKWDNSKLPWCRRRNHVMRHYHSNFKDSDDVFKDINRLQTDPSGHRLKWNTQNGIHINHKDLIGHSASFTKERKEHIVNGHPEVFPRDVLGVLKNPHKVTQGYSGGGRAKHKDDQSYRNIFYGSVGKDKDGNDLHIKVVTRPVKMRSGRIRHHVLTAHSVKSMDNKHETPVNHKDMHNAAAYTKGEIRSGFKLW